MDISRNGAGITLLSHLNIIAAVRADLEEGAALCSSGGFPCGHGVFLGFSACSCGQGKLTCPYCSIHAAQLLVNFLWNKISSISCKWRPLAFFFVFKSNLQSFSMMCFRCYCDLIRKCILDFDGIAGQLSPTWCSSWRVSPSCVLAMELFLEACVCDENQLCRSCHSMNSSMVFSL